MQQYFLGSFHAFGVHILNKKETTEEENSNATIIYLERNFYIGRIVFVKTFYDKIQKYKVIYYLHLKITQCLLVLYNVKEYKLIL